MKSWALTIPMDYTPHRKKPFYFMFNDDAEFIGTQGTCAYISDKKRWVPFEIPSSDKEQTEAPLAVLLINFFFPVPSSWGLVCFMDTVSQENIHVCNPILKNRVRLLPKTSCPLSDYYVITHSADIHSRKYVVAMLSFYPMDIFRFTHKVTIQLYDSETCSWVNLHSENSVGWWGDDTCVIWKDVIHSVASTYRVMQLWHTTYHKGGKSKLLPKQWCRFRVDWPIRNFWI